MGRKWEWAEGKLNDSGGPPSHLDSLGAQEVSPVREKGPGLYTPPLSVMGCSQEAGAWGDSALQLRQTPKSQEPEKANSSPRWIWAAQLWVRGAMCCLDL